MWEYIAANSEERSESAFSTMVRPKGMIWRNEGLRGAVAEHPVGLKVRSAHKPISLILNGIYAAFYPGNHIYVT